MGSESFVYYKNVNEKRFSSKKNGLSSLLRKAFQIGSYYLLLHLHFKEIITAGTTTDAVSEKVWGGCVSVICQILSLAKRNHDKDVRNMG